ncbi:MULTISPECIES: DUF6286 domain-containing protein [Streptomyces]|uniref:DUF6286 domain-containing protein n=2 Tax=Streptomyces TaxID=1883 RepID=A0A652KN15_9ACTN|nr:MULTISPECIES: DUF6286 domain-containing protein [unclassified Streptomyces]WSS61086.1 DUF6286 domain-containing protein [Streptomyces sp. NBC_01177]WSS68135.1 DUF6286 domain-containing protein [Streptomyces sp. NBC_01175]WSS75130.1 DUF6286 domain-containing protein [Streptomyces sp. NBC_01174]MDX3329118.1 DUF6286 domain-containing protein [Streptomyces sp. ME02-6979-3A]RPK42070.1 hypothetical protein EES40_20135 [Streptomyces sp. ADI93-02]
MTEPQEPENSTRRLPTVESAPSGGVLEMDQSASGSSYEPAPAREEPGGRAGRFWSGRRIPAALVALVVLGGCGLLLYDVAAVRADHPAMQWRRTAADDLASRHLDDVWVLAASALAAALGLWLLLLALTPGLRALLPMSRRHAGVRAGLDRTAAALVLRDRAVEVAGVQSVRVKMSRRKATVRALSHFRELDDVRADLDTVLSHAISELGLARPPGLSVHVRRPAKKG